MYRAGTVAFLKASKVPTLDYAGIALTFTVATIATVSAVTAV